LIAKAPGLSETPGEFPAQKPGKLCKMPQKWRISPRFFLGWEKRWKRSAEACNGGRLESFKTGLVSMCLKNVPV